MGCVDPLCAQADDHGKDQGGKKAKTKEAKEPLIKNAQIGNGVDDKEDLDQKKAQASVNPDMAEKDALNALKAIGDKNAEHDAKLMGAASAQKQVPVSARARSYEL